MKVTFGQGELDDDGKSPIRRRAEKTKAKSKGQALSDEQEKAQTIQVVTTSPKPNVATKEPESTKRKENKRAKKPPQAKKQKPSSPETKSKKALPNAKARSYWNKRSCLHAVRYSHGFEDNE